MSEQIFSLQPFDKKRPTDLEVIGTIARRANVLTIAYTLLGDLSKVAIAPTAKTPTRQSQLWETTCFEFFLGIKNVPEYWEFNLSPAGHWNVFRFDSYRQGLKEEMAFTTLPFDVQVEPDALSLSLKVNLGAIFPATQAIEAAIATVVEQEGQMSYWALKHPAKEADFHGREGFLLKLS